METFDLERCGNATMALAQASSALDYVKKLRARKRAIWKMPIVDFSSCPNKIN